VNTEKKNHKAQDHVWYVHIHTNLHVCVCVYMRVQISITLCVCLERRSIVRAMMTDDKGFFVHPPPLSYEMCTFVDIFLYMWEHNFSLVTPSTHHGPLTKKYDEIRLPDTLQLGEMTSITPTEMPTKIAFRVSRDCKGLSSSARRS